ncbi:ATP-dependent DNA helicase II subunit 1 [Neopestalotiopsis sp. 37M]|nr:ATP-dependent DNA helicase II subunit 1 [Neopestalotiopsis sp. 37M]
MAGYPYKREEDEDSEDEALDETSYKAQKDALIFAIEISKSMLEPPEPSDDKKASTDCAAIAALKSAYKIMQQRIISNPKDQMGIILFGTKKSKFIEYEGRVSTVSYPHCYVYQPLDVPSAEDVKTLRSLVEDGEDEDEVLVPSTTEKVQLKDLIICANQIFTTKAPNFGSRRLFIITDNDDPHPGDKDLANSAATRANDLYELGASIEIFPIIHGDAKFDATKFYDSIVHIDTTYEAIDPTRLNSSKLGDLDSLIKNINSKQTPKRAYFSKMAFELGPGLTISVNGYNILQKQAPARSCYVWLDGEKAQFATSSITRLADDDARTVSKGDIRKAYKFGGEYVYFAPEEMKDIKDWGSPVIRIIGFKDRSLLNFWMSLKKGIFIYPNEAGYVGSTRVFSALWQKLLKSQKIGIAWHVSRTNGNPTLVAIIPSRGPGDDTSGTQYLPAGLWLCPIPYADDVRPAPETKLIRAGNASVDAMNNIVRNLQLPAARYDPLAYPNPSLQWHYRILQMLALDEEYDPEKIKPEDKTKPKVRQIHKRVGGYMEDWASAADEELSKWEAQQSIKRELEGDVEEDEPRPAKKPRKAAADKPANAGDGSAINDAALKKMVQNDELSKLKVPELKALLTIRGLDAKGKKADLVERIEEWAES